jgi:hypothetical protein
MAPKLCKLVPDALCKQGKCAKPTTGCWDGCELHKNYPFVGSYSVAVTLQTQAQVPAQEAGDPVAATLMRAGESREDAIRMAAESRATNAQEAEARNEALEDAAEIADNWDTGNPDGAQIADNIRALKTAPAQPAVDERAQACVAACANIPTYQLYDEGGVPFDLAAMLDHLREKANKPAVDLVAAIEAASYQQVVDALASQGIDAEKSKFGFDELQVRTTVSGFRTAAANLARAQLEGK